MPGTLVLIALLSASAGLDDVPVLHPPATLARAVKAANAGLATTQLVIAGIPPEGAAAGVGVSAGEARVESLRRWERALKWATAGSLVITSTLGTMAAINQPTAFGDGRCITGNPILGTYGCDRGLSTLHGASGVVSTILYTSNGVLALAIPGPIGHVTEAERPWHRGLTYVHLGGIVLQPILGLIAAFPQVVGQSHAAPTDSFPRDMRTAHVILGYVTTAAFLTTLALEL
jgi:hypothetical protein